MLPRTYIFFVLATFFVLGIVGNVIAFKKYGINTAVHMSEQQEVMVAETSKTSATPDENKLREEYQAFIKRVQEMPDTSNSVSAGTPLYVLEHTRSDISRPETKFYDPFLNCELGDKMSLKKLNSENGQYVVVVDNLCTLEGRGDWVFSEDTYPLWSKDSQYVALIEPLQDDGIYGISPYTSQSLRFIDMRDIEKGIQRMHLPGVIEYGPYLEVEKQTEKITEDGHIQMIGIGRWRPPLETYVYVFDFTDWSIKQIHEVNPDENFLLHKEWGDGNSVKIYTISRDVIKQCNQLVKDLTNDEYYDDTPCKRITFSNYTQMKTYTIPF